MRVIEPFLPLDSVEAIQRMFEDIERNHYTYTDYDIRMVLKYIKDEKLQLFFEERIKRLNELNRRFWLRKCPDVDRLIAIHAKKNCRKKKKTKKNNKQIKEEKPKNPLLADGSTQTPIAKEKKVRKRRKKRHAPPSNSSARKTYAKGRSVWVIYTPMGGMNKYR